MVLALLSCLPFVVTQFPQLTDYPSHLARYHIMLDGGKSPWLALYYGFDWRWTGNLGADILIQPLAALFGLEPAGRIVGAIIPPLTGLGIVAVEWALRRRVGVGGLLAFTAIWSPSMGLGFYNFCLSVALALFAFALWVKLDGWRWRPLLFLFVAPLVFLCHTSGWGVLGVLVLGYEWTRRRFIAAIFMPWPLVPPLFLLLAQAGETVSLGGNTLTYKWAIARRVLRDQSMWLDQGSLVLLVSLLLLATAFRKIDPRVAWGALLLGIMGLAFPRHLAGGDYADFRLMSVALMLGCLAVTWQAPRWLFYAAPLLFLVRLGVTTQAWVENSRETAEALKALDHVPRGARVAGAVLVDSARWGIDPFEHAPSYATVRRDALVNSHFVMRGVHMLKLRPDGWHYADPSHRLLQRRTKPVDLSRFAPAREADFLWYFGSRKPDRLPQGAVILHTTRHSLLARLAKAPPGR